jgi:hypothetical protein
MNIGIILETSYKKLSTLVNLTPFRKVQVVIYWTEPLPPFFKLGKLSFSNVLEHFELKI